ncbi:MAG: hypothetical protein A2X64_03925 [Ignavibacteria bacterium GWF2_33_9]|nr:MAG: hypothetical protein A2X64_03925 [Ignavibacteria bacterium GWF2_33_9]
MNFALNISPNPATDYITIEISPLEKRGLGGVLHPIRIINVLGYEVLTTAIENGVETQNFVSLQQIDVSALPPGVYFIRVGDVVQKFVKM